MERIKLRASEFAVFDMSRMLLRDIIMSGDNQAAVIDAFAAIERLIPLLELDRGEIPGAQL